jgi:hypothetical protein
MLRQVRNDIEYQLVEKGSSLNFKVVMEVAVL